MGRKRKRELPPFCYYCYSTTEPNSLVTFPNEAQLLLHQKKQHFRCPRCKKQFPSIHALAAHASVVHNEQITKVPNASKEMENETTLQVFGMQNVPEHILIHRANLCSGAAKTKTKQEKEREDLIEFEKRIRAEFIIQQHKLARERGIDPSTLPPIAPPSSSAAPQTAPVLPPQHLGYSVIAPPQPYSTIPPIQLNRPGPIAPPPPRPPVQAGPPVTPLATRTNAIAPGLEPTEFGSLKKILGESPVKEEKTVKIGS